MWDTIISYAAALSAGVASGLAFYCVFDLLNSFEFDRTLSESKHLPILCRLMMPLVPNFRFLAKKDIWAGSLRKVERNLNMAGCSELIEPVDFVALQICSFTIGMILFVLLALSGSLLLGMVILAALAWYPNAWLKKKIQSRHLEIMRALPNVLDLLTLSVEAGRDFMTALRDILGRRKLDALGEELYRAFNEIQLGKSRVNALRDLSERVNQSDLSAVISAIIQSEELGVSIGNLLRIQGDMLRNKRFSRAEKLTNEAPVKILLPVVLFIFPTVFIILGVPVLMRVLNALP